ncbi:hypothetical protein APHAL10511_000396 [Amanita phalloides]|nr:hypothetical protein APHAL10511_000396 [Amanita phalloides]
MEDPLTDTVHVCLDDAITCLRLLHSPPLEAQGFHFTLDPASPYSSHDDDTVLQLLKSLVFCRRLAYLNLPKITPAHTLVVTNFSMLAHLTVGKINLFIAVHILTMCTSLQDVEFQMVSYSTKQSLPPLLEERQQLKAMRSVRISDAQCHFMDLLHHFGCPNLQVLDVTNSRIQSSVGERLRWFLSCESALTDFLLHSVHHLTELSVFDDNESDPLDAGLPETLHYVFNQILRRPTCLQKVSLPRLSQMPFICNGFKFLHDLRDAVALLSQEMPLDHSVPTPPPGTLRAYIQNSIRGVACPRPREGHVPLARDHSTNIIPSGYVFACEECPQKMINEKSILAIRTFAELANFHYDIRIGDRIVLNC